MPTSTQVKKTLAEAMALLRAKDASSSAAAVTLTSAIAEAIYDIDSSQTDAAGGEEKPSYSEGGSIKKGKLQQIQDLRSLLFGGEDSNGNTNQGVFEALGV